MRQLTASNSLTEKELVAAKVLQRDYQQQNESLKRDLSASKQELSETKALAAARNSEEAQRNLSHEVALRHKIQLQFEEESRRTEDEKLAMKMRCDELVRTLQSADADRFRWIHSDFTFQLLLIHFCIAITAVSRRFHNFSWVSF